MGAQRKARGLWMSCEEGAVCSPKLGYLQNLQQQSCLPQRWGIFHMLAPSTSAT